MPVVALGALATAMLSRQYGETGSLAALEMGELRAHAPDPDHPYARLLAATLKDFTEMDREAIWTWAVALIGPLDDARREADRRWEWLIVSEIVACCRSMLKRR